MGMSIDKSITELEILKKNTFSYMSAHQAFTTAVIILRKYQKIQEIVKNTQQLCSYGSAFIDIREVVEDGSINN